jgi:lipoate-protein ligase A
MLKIIFTSDISAQEIMDLDKKLLENITEPTLHFYNWKYPSITYGYFIDPKKYLNLENLNKLNIDIARRPTGGGIVFHLWDMAFSFLLPSTNKNFSLNTLENYFFVNSCVLSAVKDFLNIKDEDIDLIKHDFSPSESSLNFCMARPTKYDVLIENKKVGGAAQRRIQKGYLHQGTIALLMPQKEILENILLDKKTLSFMFSNTFALFEKKVGDQKRQKTQLQELLIKYFKKSLF